MCSKNFAKNKKKTLNESFDEDEKIVNELYDKFRAKIAQVYLKLLKYKKVFINDYVNLIITNEEIYDKQYEDVYGTLEEQTTFINALKNELKTQIDAILNLRDSDYIFKDLEKDVRDAYDNFEYTINGDADNLLMEGFANYISNLQLLMENIEKIEKKFLESDFKRDSIQFLNCEERYKKYCLARLNYDVSYVDSLVVPVEKYIFHIKN